MATVSQIINMKENELEHVCNFMGHDICVHREYYRLPSDTFQLTKLSRLLIAMDQGKVSSFQGKELNDIDICFNISFDNEDEL